MSVDIRLFVLNMKSSSSRLLEVITLLLASIGGSADISCL